MTTTRFQIEKQWDENERTREGQNGRRYTSRAGRWQWIVIVDDLPDSAHDTYRAAEARVAALAETARAAGRAVSGPGPVWLAPPGPAPVGDRAALAASARAHAEARYCSACGRHVSTTDDWTLYPWGDGASLCSQCNDTRHETEEYR